MNNRIVQATNPAIIILTIIIILITTIIIKSCSEENDSTYIEVESCDMEESTYYKLSKGTSIFVFTIEGHRYMKPNSSEGRITHMQSCICKNPIKPCN